MSERDDERHEGTTSGREEVLGADAERARSALREAPHARSDGEFRQRLKQEFCSGAIEVTAARDGLTRARGRGRSRREERVVPFRVKSSRRSPLLWIGAPVAVAAALALVFGALNRGPTWWVTAARGDGAVRVDGQTIALDDRDALRRAIVPGAEIEVSANAELDLCSDGVVGIQLVPGTRMTLPPPPGRWVARKTELYVRGGELRVTTGRRFPGAALSIMSPTAAVEIKGTTIAVIIEDAGTCVCVYDGSAAVGKRSGAEGVDMMSVPNGMRRYIYKDGRPPEMDQMRAEERGKLAAFRESLRPWLESRGPQEAPSRSD